MIEAAEVPAVVARLHDRGLIPLSIASGDGARPRAAGVQLPALPALGRRRVKGRDLLVMTQELSALVSSGLPLDRSLATLADLADNPELKRILTEVLHAVQGGKSLAEALGQHRAFPPLREHDPRGRDRRLPRARAGAAGRVPRARAAAAGRGTLGAHLPGAPRLCDGRLDPRAAHLRAAQVHGPVQRD